MIATISLLATALAGPGAAPLQASVASALQGGEARLHPADAVLYFEIPDVPAVAQAYTQSSYGRLLVDQGFQAALGGVLGAESFDPLGELEALYSEGVESGEIPPFRDLFLRPLRSLSFSLSARDGRLGPILRALESGALPESAEDVPSFLRSHLGLELALQFESPVAAQDFAGFLLSFMEGQGAAREDRKLEFDGGGEILLTTIDTGAEELPSLRFFRAGARVVLLSGMHATEACAGRLAGGSDGLAGSAELSAGAKHFGPRRGTVVFEGFSSIGDQFVSSMDVPDLGPAIDVLEGLFGPLVTMVTRGGRWRVQLTDGRFVTEGFHSIPASGPLDGLFASAPLEGDALGLVHPEAIVGWVAHLDRQALAALLARLVATDAPTAGTEPNSVATDEGERYGAVMDEVERAYGFRPDRDIVEPLGSAVAWSLPPVRSLLAAPPFMLTIGLRDAPAFGRGMDGVFALIGKEAEGELAVSQTRYRDTSLYTVQFVGESNLDLGEIPFDPMGFFKPTVAVLPDRVIVTTLPSHAKREIRRLLKAAAEVHPLLAAGQFPEGASEVGFADWVSFVGKIYDGLVPLASMAEELLGPIPVDLASLPKSEVFTGFFEPAVRWERRGEDGVFHHAESSFGPEVPFALALVGLGGALWSMPGQAAASEQGSFEFEITAPDDPSAIAPPTPSDPVQLSIARLASVRVALTVYQLDQGKLPADLKALTQPTGSYPHGFLDGDEVPPDAWGRPLRYETTAAGYRLWSTGPDGVDQGGAGDDILSR